MSRVTPLVVLVVLVGACGADGDSAGLSQLAADDALTFSEDGVIAADTVSPADTAVGEDTQVVSDTAVVEDTAVVADTVVADTVVSDTVVSDTVSDTVVSDTLVADTVVISDTVATDTIEPPCQHDSDCPAGPCQRATCVLGECVVLPDDVMWCDDGDPCTRDDFCLAGVCTPGLSPLPCDDDDACTSDTCVAGEGCAFTPISCEPPGDPCKVAKCDPAFGCGVANAMAGTPCDDGDACTVDDACSAGHCAGAPKVCGDEDPCTSDACVAGGCVSTPIVCDDDDACTTDSCVDGACHFAPIPGCGVVPCGDEAPGAACDDGDPATTADLCLAGRCRGFTETRVSAGVAGLASLAISEIDFAAGQWWGIYWAYDDQYDVSYAITQLTDPSAPSVATTTEDLLRGLGHGFVGDASGRVRTAFTGWSTDNAWDEAVGDSGRGAVNALWANPSRTALWLMGADGDDDWIRFCERDGQEVSCEEQRLDDFQPSSIPKAVAGLEDACVPGQEEQSCNTRLLVTGADGPSSQTNNAWFKDAYDNVGGAQDPWGQAFIPNTPSSSYTVAAIAWGDGDFLLMGTGGFLRHRRVDGTWSYALDDLVSGQSQRAFTGGWAGSGLIVLSAFRVADGRSYWELWTCPQAGDVESAASWTIHALDDHPTGQLVGLYDVRGRADGELRAVGGIPQPPSNVLTDGVVYVRDGGP